MKNRACNIIAGLSVLVLLALAPFAASRAQTTTIKDQLVGHWDLVSITINDAAAYGSGPHGSMILSADGHYSVIVLSDGGARNISYFGTYTVSDADKTLTMHVDGSTRAKTEGRDQKRQITLDGDNLVVSNPTGGRGGAIKITWKRAS